MKRTPQQRLKAIGISALPGIFSPYLILYNSAQLMRTYGKPSNTKYESRLKILHLVELMFEALPQSILNWFILYYVDLGDGYILYVNATVLSLSTSTISLVIGVLKWSLFIASMGQENTFLSTATVAIRLIKTLAHFLDVKSIALF